MDKFVVMGFWFVLALALLGSCLWLIWPQLKPSPSPSSGMTAPEQTRIEFEVYWQSRGDGSTDGRTKRAAWESWKTCAARARPRTTPAEVCTSLFGIAGAWLLATQMHPAFGFAAFLVSNVNGIRFSKRQRHPWLLAQQVFFLLSSLVGLWNWWLGPLLLG